MSNMVVRTNIFALNAHRNMKNVGVDQNRASNRLASGFRINSAADDAAGLAISESMRAQIRGLDQASRNAQDGQALINTAEGGMQEIQNMIQRMRELTVQAANDTNTVDNRGEHIALEIRNLLLEIDDMANRVEYNGMNLLDGSFAPQFSVQEISPEIVTTVDVLTTQVHTHGPEGETVIGGVTFVNPTPGTGGATFSVTATITETITIPAVNDYVPEFGSRGLHFQVGANENQLMWTSIRNMSVLADTHGSRATGDYAGSATQALAEGGSLGHAMRAFISNWETAFRMPAAHADVTAAAGGSPATVDISGWGLNTPDATNDSAATQAQALSALVESIEAGVQFTSLARAELGAVSNRLEFTSRSLDISSENLSDAESRVRNTDMAREMMNFTMANVLQQASVSMLAQANQLPNNLLQLLR